MTDSEKYEVLKWSQVYCMLLSQANKICKSGFNPDIIVGVSRGGWLPARVLSDLLENPNLANVRAESYVGVNKSKNKPSLTQSLSMAAAGKTVLVTDEVADSGKSIRLIVDHVKELGAVDVRTAALYYKPSCRFKPDYSEKVTDRWVVFPWEIKETLRLIYEANKNSSPRIEKEIKILVKAGYPKRLIKRFLNEFSEVEPC
jgi:hypoxanthine phosphoribosyltransferase